MSDVASQERVVEAGTARPADTPAASREDRARTSSYSRRFAVLYIALALVTGIAVGAFIVVALHDDASSQPATRAATRFQPTEPGELGAMQIAEDVQRAYRLPNGQELVNVVASRNTLQDGNLGYLRVRYQLFRPADGVEDKDTKVEIPQDAIQYSLCGSGQACVIPGNASADRGLLVRRMGLELALRTMKFDPAVDNVTVFLRPMPADGSDGVVLVFRRNVLERLNPGLLTQPLERTLPGVGSQIQPGQMREDIARRVDQLTRPHLYYGVYQLIGGRDALLQLQPFPKG
ncbi:MAG TPA: hypothetical protein VIQ78_02665 [Terrimesophilobacter sp.]|jgi:hypothetical protein|uniref:hypothetical protein n=1 Tax=Terrimesophilobacter sp. TaxID=2906435 RepID=UPI002F92B76F